MENIEDKLTYHNWENFTKEIAEQFFPKGSLVDWHYGGSIHFGIVTSISKTGKITIQKGKLPMKKVTDNEGTGGMYGKFWYEGDIKKFEPFTKESPEIKNHYETPKTRFQARCFLGKDWKERKHSSPIEYTQTKGNRMLVLAKPEIKDGYIIEESYSD